MGYVLRQITFQMDMSYLFLNMKKSHHFHCHLLTKLVFNVRKTLGKNLFLMNGGLGVMNAPFSWMNDNYLG